MSVDFVCNCWFMEVVFREFTGVICMLEGGWIVFVLLFNEVVLTAFKFNQVLKSNSQMFTGHTN